MQACAEPARFSVIVHHPISLSYVAPIHNFDNNNPYHEQPLIQISGVELVLVTCMHTIKVA
jgi:hypothetical protein